MQQQIKTTIQYLNLGITIATSTGTTFSFETFWNKYYIL
jgi:hypothetical protein